MNRYKMTRILIFFMICLFVFLLSGCWDRREVNDIAIVVALGVDKKEDKYVLSTQIIVPKAAGTQLGSGSGGSSDGMTLVRYAEGENISDAMSYIQEKIPRRIFWGHNQIVVFGEEAAKEGVQPHLDFMARHPNTRLRSYVLVSKGKAKDFLELSPPLERHTAEILRELSKMQTLMGVTLKDFTEMLGSDMHSAAVPFIEYLPPEEGKGKLDTIPYITGTALFKEDKMIGTVNDKVTRGLQWILNEVKYAIVTVEPKDSGLVSFQLLRAKSELIPQIKDGKWIITIKGVTEDDIIQNGSKLNVMNTKIVDKLEPLLQKDIEERIMETVDLVQKDIKVDVFGFGRAFHREYPEKWAKVKDHWEEIFPTVEVKTEIKAYIRRPGNSTTPQITPEEEVINE